VICVLSAFLKGLIDDENEIGTTRGSPWCDRCESLRGLISLENFLLARFWELIKYSIFTQI